MAIIICFDIFFFFFLNIYEVVQFFNNKNDYNVKFIFYFLNKNKIFYFYNN